MWSSDRTEGWSKEWEKEEVKKMSDAFFTLSSFWSFTLESEEMAFTHQLPVGIRGHWQLQ